MGLDEYLEQVTAQIRCRQARELVAEELKAHMEDQAMALERAGEEPERAMAEAVRRMGDPVETGTALDRVHRPRMDWKLVALIGLLTALGLGVQYSLGENGRFWEQCAAAAAGWGLMILVCWLDYSLLGRYGTALWWGFTALIVAVLAFGPSVNGAHLYLRPVFGLYGPLYAAILYRHRGGGYGALVRCGLYVAMMLFLAVRAGTLPLCMDLGLIALVLTHLAIRRNWFRVPQKKAFVILWMLAVLVPALALLWGVLGGLPSYQIARIQAVLQNWKDPEGAGYMVSQVRRILDESRLIGAGTAGSEPVVLPNVGTDFVLVHVISYYGIAAGLAITAILSGLVLRLFRVSARQKHQLGYLVGTGCGLVFALQIMHYVLVNVGLSQVGLAGLPFFSFGRYHTITEYLLLGLILSIFRYQDVLRDYCSDRSAHLLR